MRFVPTNVPPPLAQEVRDTRMRMCRNNLGLAIECARALLSRFANQDELGSSRPAHRTIAEGDEHSLVLRFVGGVLRGVRESRERGGARWALSSAELVALFVAAGTHRGARAHALRVALLSEPTAFWADAHAADASESEAALSFLRVAVDTIVADVNFDVDVIPPANTFAASWSINGTAADSTLCTEAGIATVRLNFFDDAGGTSLAQSFDFDCGVGGFDSRDGGQPTMPEGMFFNQWQALDGSGAVVGETLAPFPEADTTAVDHINLAGPDFEVSLTPTLRVNFQYELADALGSYGTCTEAGVVDSNYLFFLFDGGGTMVSLDPAITTCQNFVEFPDITPDTYAVEVSGESFDGAIKWGTGVPTSCGGLIAESGLEEYDCFVDIVP